MRYSLSWACLAVSMSLAGCGGGGGGSSSPSTTAPSNSTATVVTAANQDRVSRSSNTAAAVATSAANPELATLLVGGVETQPSVAPAQGILPAAVALSERLQALRAQPDFVGGISSSKQVACKKAGYAKVTMNNANASTYTLGDTGLIEFSACDDGKGSVLSGKVSSTVTASSVSSSSSTVGMKMVFENYKATSTTGAVGTTLDGTADLKVVADTQFVLTTLGALTFNIAYGSENFAMANLGVVHRFNRTTSESTQMVYQSFVHTLPGTSISGRILVTVALKGGAITAGNLRFYGNGSDVYLTYLGNENVKLEADFDSNGTMDSSKMTNLAALN